MIINEEGLEEIFEYIDKNCDNEIKEEFGVTTLNGLKEYVKAQIVSNLEYDFKVNVSYKLFSEEKPKILNQNIDKMEFLHDRFRAKMSDLRMIIERERNSKHYPQLLSLWESALENKNKNNELNTIITLSYRNENFYRIKNLVNNILDDLNDITEESNYNANWLNKSLETKIDEASDKVSEYTNNEKKNEKEFER